MKYHLSFSFGGDTMAKRNGRIYLLDEIRALALIGMIVYHTAYDLRYLFGVSFDFQSFGWNTLQKAVCCTFIVIAGISTRLSKKPLKHGIVVFAAGLLMTAGTAFFIPDQIIVFGILHFLGISMMIAYLFRKGIQKANAPLGILFSLVLFFACIGINRGTVVFGKVLVPPLFYTNTLTAILGFPPKGFASADYFPLLPWLFLFLTGCFLGKYFKERKIPDFFFKQHSRFLSVIGSNTLVIYILHQPVIYAALTLIFWLIEKGNQL